MPDITIQVPRTDYPSLQIGDTAYYSTITTTAGINTSNSFTKIGLITGISNTTALDDGTETTTLTCEIDEATAVPTTSDFIFFSKDNKVNLTSLLGYYASVKFKNDSANKAEMFSIGCEIAESSK
mgnify:CR=1 FL=1